MCKSLRWYYTGAVLAVAAITCSILGDHAVKREIFWAEATKAKESAEHGVSGNVS